MWEWKRRSDGVAKDNLKFEEALKRLEQIVDSIEQGKIGLEDSIKSYEEGMALVRRCRAVLQDAEQKIQHLQSSGADGLTESTVVDQER